MCHLCGVKDAATLAFSIEASAAVTCKWLSQEQCTAWGNNVTNHRKSHRLAGSPTAHIDLALLGPGTRPCMIDRSDLGTRIGDSSMLPTVDIVLVTTVTCRQSSQKYKEKIASNSRATEVHWPDAHAKPLAPQPLPFGVNKSAGQAEEFPVHDSAVSQVASLEARQTCVAGANLHCAVQHGALSGSQTALFRNLQVLGSQHDEFEPLPGSQSSPFSTIPLPHICSEMVWREGSGFRRQLVSTLLACEPCITEPKWDVGEDNAREVKILLRTDVPDRTL